MLTIASFNFCVEQRIVNDAKLGQVLMMKMLEKGGNRPEWDPVYRFQGSSMEMRRKMRWDSSIHILGSWKGKA